MFELTPPLYLIGSAVSVVVNLILSRGQIRGMLGWYVVWAIGWPLWLCMLLLTLIVGKGLGLIIPEKRP